MHHKHNNETQNFIFTDKTQYKTHKTQKIYPKPKIVKKMLIITE